MAEAKSLYASLMKARAEFPPIVKDRENQNIQRGGKSYKYATLDAILHAVVGVLANNDIILYQVFEEGEGVPLVKTVLRHTKTDEALTSTLPISIKGSFQDIGACITYMKRYSVVAMLALAVDEDTDGVGDNGKPVAAPMESSGTTVLARAKDAIFKAEDFETLMAKINAIGDKKSVFDEYADFDEAMRVARVKADGFPASEKKVLIGTIKSYLES